jgi:hypothetical protein
MNQNIFQSDSSYIVDKSKLPLLKEKLEQNVGINMMSIDNVVIMLNKRYSYIVGQHRRKN